MLKKKGKGKLKIWQKVICKSQILDLSEGPDYKYFIYSFCLECLFSTNDLAPAGICNVALLCSLGRRPRGQTLLPFKRSTQLAEVSRIWHSVMQTWTTQTYFCQHINNYKHITASFQMFSQSVKKMLLRSLLFCTCELNKSNKSIFTGFNSKNQ